MCWGSLSRYYYNNNIVPQNCNILYILLRGVHKLFVETFLFHVASFLFLTVTIN